MKLPTRQNTPKIRLSKKEKNLKCREKQIQQFQRCSSSNLKLPTTLAQINSNTTKPQNHFLTLSTREYTPTNKRKRGKENKYPT
jgi:hypothetical protein